MKRLDITGHRRGKMVALKPAPNIGKRTAWVFRCDCGNESYHKTDVFMTGKLYHCGKCPNKTLQERFEEKVQQRGADDCWPWQGSRHPKGHGQLGRGRRGSGNIYAHVAAWEFAVGPVPSGLVVCHKCDNPPCCNPSHLFLGTRRDNLLDMQQKRRHIYGSKAKNAKLTEEAVAEIRTAYDAGSTQQSLAEIYGVSRTVIGAVTQRKIWTHVP